MPSGLRPARSATFYLGIPLALVVAAFIAPGCGDAESPSTSVTDACAASHADSALSRCLTPKQPAAYYVEQSQRYFDTLDVSASPATPPNYSELAARWEWPPWLKLTGYTAKILNDTASLVTSRDPSTIPTRECRAFDVQPFGRCHVTFEFEGGPCAIYEEFTFNDQGEMTFIEAWTDSPALLPMDPSTDPWAEGANVRRLSTRVPGLGAPTGRIDPAGTAMSQVAKTDADVADFAHRAQDFWGTWFEEVATNGKDIYARGCGW